MANDEVNNLGIGVLVNWLSGNEETVEALKNATDKEIASIQFQKNPYRDKYGIDKLVLKFTDGTGLRFWDDGQSCCEYRYMVCDDEKEFPSYVGAKFLKAELVYSKPIEGEYGDMHEIQFLNIITTKGVIQCATHNEHNGYYGGFYIKVDSKIGE